MKARRFIALSMLVAMIMMSSKCGDDKPVLELSWTDYNSVTDFCDYFLDVENITQHSGDTVKVWGWLYKTHNGPGSPVQYLCDRQYPDWTDMAQVLYNPYVNILCHEWDINDTLEETFQRKAYVTGVLYGRTYPNKYIGRSVIPQIHLIAIEYGDK